VLCVAIPEAHVRFGPLMLPVGRPAPFSVEVSGIASMTAFLSSTVAQQKEGSLAAIEFGTRTSTFAIFNKGVLSLVRRFSFGAQAVLDKVRERLGVDAETAQGIVADGSFDISQPLNEVMDSFVKQLLVSRDFVERRENCHVAKLYVGGGLAGSAGVIEDMRSSLEIDVERWDPFEGLQVAKDAMTEQMAAQRWRFGAAVGACLGTFEET
jgi:Tfp pilus assembly PilM family ATPase